MIKQATEAVGSIKKYHTNSPFGQKEHIGEYSLFDNIGNFTKGFVLKSYTFDKVNHSDDDIFLRLWFSPICENAQLRRHIKNVDAKCDSGWY